MPPMTSGMETTLLIPERKNWRNVFTDHLAHSTRQVTQEPDHFSVLKLWVIWASLALSSDSQRSRRTQRPGEQASSVHLLTESVQAWCRRLIGQGPESPGLQSGGQWRTILPRAPESRPEGLSAALHTQHEVPRNSPVGTPGVTSS